MCSYDIKRQIRPETSHSRPRPAPTPSIRACALYIEKVFASQYMCARCCSVTESCPTLSEPVGCSRPGSSVLSTSQSLPRVMSIVLVVHPTPHPLLAPSPLPSIFPRIKVFSDGSALPIWWAQGWSFRLSSSVCPPHPFSRWWAACSGVAVLRHSCQPLGGCGVGPSPGQVGRDRVCVVLSCVCYSDGL